MRRFRMKKRVQTSIEANQPPAIQRRTEVRREGGHCELHVPPALIQEVAQWAAGHDVSASGAARVDRCADEIDGPVFAELLFWG